ncbi:MAG: ribonuclease Z [Actinomycetota bacterium]|nr:ribonuclease Z [Actinomycetota bacterium]
MSPRELVVLGTAAQAPTRARNTNGYLLRWGDEGVLFDPGEGTQRQLLLAGVPASAITRICLTHSHGDHTLGLPGVLARLVLDGVRRPVDLCFPSAAAPYVDALRRSATGNDALELRLHPVDGAGTVLQARGFRVVAQPLDHRVPALGWRVEEPDGLRVLPERLAAYGIDGPDVGRLLREGTLVRDGRSVTVADVTAARAGSRFALAMDTRLGEGVRALADGVDLLVCESTYLAADGHLAEQYAHLTAAQAARLARDAGVRTLVLTHFSRRYGADSDTGAAFLAEAQAVLAGSPTTVVAARDLDRVPMPPRREE